jgi:hypothetical protein
MFSEARSGSLLRNASKSIEPNLGGKTDMYISLRVCLSSKHNLAKWGSEIRENHDLQTHLNCIRVFTGNLINILIINS